MRLLLNSWAVLLQLQQQRWRSLAAKMQRP
jgi:hypothetical protein